MPKRNDASTHAARRTGEKFSHAELEARRDVLFKRLQRLPPRLRSTRGYANARVLLGASYMRATITARMAVLQTAQFMISVLEMLPPL